MELQGASSVAGNAEDNGRITSGPSSRITAAGDNLQTGEEVRRSTRSNFGIGPPRLGYGPAGQEQGLQGASAFKVISQIEKEDGSGSPQSADTVVPHVCLEVPCMTCVNNFESLDKIRRTPVQIFTPNPAITQRDSVTNWLQQAGYDASMVEKTRDVVGDNSHVSESAASVRSGGSASGISNSSQRKDRVIRKLQASLDYECKLREEEKQALDEQLSFQKRMNKLRMEDELRQASRMKEEYELKLQQQLSEHKAAIRKLELAAERQRQEVEDCLVEVGSDGEAESLHEAKSVRGRQSKQDFKETEAARDKRMQNQPNKFCGGGFGDPEDPGSDDDDQKSMKPYKAWERRDSAHWNQKRKDDDEGSQPPSRRGPYTQHYSSQRKEESQEDDLAAMMKAVMEKVALSCQPRKDESEVKRMMTRQVVGKDLPEFSGSPSAWPMFISQYRQTTKTCGFSNAENLSRLIKCLRGSAKDAVAASLTHPDNVDSIIKTLELRFGRPEDIIDAIAKKLRQHPTIRETDLEGLIIFSTEVQNLVATITALEKDDHLYNPLLMKELVAKLPTVSVMTWAHAKVELRGRCGLKEFSLWLSKLATTLAEVVPCSVGKEAFQDKEKVTGKKVPFKPTTGVKRKETVLATGCEEEKSCLSCSRSGHIIQECRTFAKKSEEEKTKLVKEKNLCFSCLKSGHPARKCREKKPCSVEGCGRFHHESLHRKDPKPKAVKNVEADSTETVAFSKSSKAGVVLLKILPVTIRGPKGSVKTYAMLDDGCTTTLMDDELAKKLGVSGPRKSLRLVWTNGVTRTYEDSEVVAVKVSGADSKEYSLPYVRTVKDLELPTQSLNQNELADRWDFLGKVKVEDYVNARPLIMIGSHQAGLIASRKIIDGSPSAPVLVKTRLGWIIYGDSGSSPPEVKAEKVFTLQVDEELQETVKSYFRIDCDGVKLQEEKPRSKEDKVAAMVLETTTKLLDGRYETGLLWKNDNPILPESYDMAYRRLRSIERKMDRDPQYAAAYSGKIEEYLGKGYAVLLSKEERKSSLQKTWFLPHFGVVNPNKPKKLRFVFDAAAKSKGRSLNDHLLTGPDLYNSLVDVLCKFRQRSVAICGDIKEMFHQVKIRREDVTAQRFLWRGQDRDKEPEWLEMRVMIFGAACSPCSAQYVKNLNASRFEEQYPRAADAIIHRHYMDDYLDSCDTMEEARELLSQVAMIHESGGFIICNWISSSPEVLQGLKEEDVAPSFKDFASSGTDIPTERVLGLTWNAKEDCFVFSIKFHKVEREILEEGKIPTKRQFLRVVMSVFDPLGFLSPLIVEAKILLQEIWRSQVGWDDEILEDHAEKWRDWFAKIREVGSLKIPRCYFRGLGDAEDIQLHIFVDASERAYCCVGYLRFKYGEEVQVSLVASKTRVAPLKSTSIPRLELQAAVIGSRLAKSINGALDLAISKTVLWTDSRTVMCWITSTSGRFKTFVAHRIGEILENTDSSQWNWVPTLDNVADDATRMDAELNQESRWLSGPGFLQAQEENWPKAPDLEVKEDDLERKEIVLVAASLPETNDSLPDILATSSYERLIRTTLLVQRFVDRCKKRPVAQLTVELKEAEKRWWKEVQVLGFHEDIHRLKTGQPLLKESKLRQLEPFIDEEGVLRVKGRQGRSEDMDFAAKHPVILDGSHRFTRMLIEEHHKRNGHHGMETVCNSLRQQFHIPKMRLVVKSVWSKCLVCRIQKSKPNPPLMGDLPECRLNKLTRAFHVTGMDYFGPIKVTVGRHHEDRYGVLFTCMATRAVHLEIADSLTTDSCIMAIRRFLGRRGAVQKIYSDNGTNLKGSDRELRQALESIEDDEIKKMLAKQRIEWHFIPPSSPHMGGSWERLVKSVKVALKAVLKEAFPRPEVLHTFMTEVEHMVNSRPLTHVSMDPADDEALTPNHFLIGPSNCVAAPGEFTDDEFYLRKQWKKSQRYADLCWKRWIREYLPTLTRRSKWLKRVDPPKVGDVAILVDEKFPRNTWPKGIIEAVYPGRDGQVRVVDLRTSTGTYRRPIAKIAVLDLKTDGVGEPTPGGSMSPCTEPA